jgi:hypothetical protein
MTDLRDHDESEEHSVGSHGSISLARYAAMIHSVRPAAVGL